jgi:hypothetical protein
MHLPSCSKPAVLGLALLGCRLADLVSAPAAGLTFTRQPVAAEQGEPITPPVEVTILNTQGVRDSTSSHTVTMTLAAHGSGGTVSGTTEVKAVNGIATFANLRINQPGQGFVLRAVTGAVSAASASFDVEQPPAAQLVFTVQPSSSRANQPITPAIVVTALAGDGDPVPWFDGPVTLAIAPNALGGAATGTLTVNASGGVARFTDVRVDRVGLDYRLTAAFAGAAPGRTSEPFAITP